MSNTQRNLEELNRKLDAACGLTFVRSVAAVPTRMSGISISVAAGPSPATGMSTSVPEGSARMLPRWGLVATGSGTTMRISTAFGAEVCAAGGATGFGAGWVSCTGCAVSGMGCALS